jgi:hypothetical protein
MASIKVRQATKADLSEYSRLQAERWRDDNKADDEKLLSRFKTYPEGMLVAEENGKIVGMVFAMRIADYDYDNPPSWYDITNNGMCDNHVPDGKIIFGVDLSTAPGVGGRAGDALLIGIGRIAIKENLEWCMLGGRMPGYHMYKDKMSAEDYLWSKGDDGKFLDKQVRYYSSVPGLMVIKALPNYFHDPDSCDYGVLLRWHNPLYNWPFPHFWSALFPVLFRLEEKYLSLRRRLKHRNSH